ncbi:hypothetical protein QBC38DRAFT_509008 [Podospora fimiseda]|uniref:Uncharacterized protein n=1 Tax=Podospora fimiseda TaxID=252190 RepID=A0AAN7BRT5_9PEZI|nr:hypothetical protein QBC38DRAFT_509008 [Podospora fimiseda]
MRTRSGGATGASPGNASVSFVAMSERQGYEVWDTEDYNPGVDGRNTRSQISLRSPPVRHSLSTRRSKRARLQTSSYVEPSTDDEDYDQAAAELQINNDNPHHPHQLNLVPVDQSPSPNPRTYKATKKQSPVLLKLRTTNLESPRKVVKAETTVATTNGQDVVKPFVPKWLDVPYRFWVDIFDYAASMVVNEDREKDERRRAQWLLSASTICRELSEAALTALYRAPPIVSRSMAHSLTALLLKDPSTTLYNYQPKIKTLSINVAEIASKSYKGEQLDYKALVGNLSRLKFLSFWHWKDEPEWKQMNDPIRWSYPDELFQALQDANSRLDRWIWNRRFLGSDTTEAFEQVKKVHQTKPFSDLKRLDLLNFQLPSVLHRPKANPTLEELAEIKDNDDKLIERIAESIQLLPTLEHLSIGYSTVANTPLFNLLPKSLRSFTLLRCWEVDDNALASFLMSHGSQLEHLSLQHNPRLTLAFLTCLKAACPKLLTLSVDFQIYPQREFRYFETEPDYDFIMTPEEVPQWPETLEVLEVKNARKWSPEAAEVFFRSLVDEAPNLLKLRCIDLKIRLDIPIRQRSEIRDRWVSRFEKVFLREQIDPLPFHSLRSDVYRHDHAVIFPKMSPVKKRSPGHQKGSSWAETESPVRMSSRLLAASQEAADLLATSLSSNNSEGPSSLSSRSSSVVRDLRTGLSRPSYAEPETDDEEDLALGGEDKDVSSLDEKTPGEEEQETNEEPEPPLFRHGMCEKVELIIDNQKNAEVLYGMHDFLDRDDTEDNTSDEDWNGADRDYEDGGLAW